MSVGTIIRPFVADDAAAVRELFILMNRLLAPPDMREAFEGYIARSLNNEIDRLQTYYGEHYGGFWVALRGGRLAGMFGLEDADLNAMELRRMYVHSDARRIGLGSLMLRFAENECRSFRKHEVTLSTSELQPAALLFYEAAGYQRVAAITATDLSNKTVGDGIQRYHLEKNLWTRVRRRRVLSSTALATVRPTNPDGHCAGV